MRPANLPMRGQGLAAPLFVISGNQAAGKTTVSGLLAARFERGAHVSGDAMQTMIVAGRRWPEIPDDLDPDTGEVTGEAAHQLRLRLKNACLLARSFAESGIMAVIDDIVVGTRFADLLEDLAGTPFHFVMLRPRVDVLSVREQIRGSDDWETRRHIEAGIESTPRAGLWLDTSEQTAEETMQEILRRGSESLVDPKVVLSSPDPGAQNIVRKLSGPASRGG